MGWYARERWFKEKALAAETVAQLLLRADRMQDTMTILYTLLGGTSAEASPIVITGGAAFCLYMSREVALHAEDLPAGLCTFAQAADLDFAATEEPANLVRSCAVALHWLADVSADIWPAWQAENKQWQLRRDAKWGEAFYHCCRADITPAEATPTAEFPIKLSLHMGMHNPTTGEDFRLLRLGAAVWHKKLSRAAIAAFVDVSLNAKVLPSTTVMGMRLQSPRSMLKELRRMTFHETHYAPWWAAYGDETKGDRRLERLVKLSFVEDFKVVGGLCLGRSACLGLQQRWKKALEMLVLGQPAELRHLAWSAPRNMQFLMLCLARMLEEVLRFNNMEDFDAWMAFSLYPCITDVVLEDV